MANHVHFHQAYIGSRQDIVDLIPTTIARVLDVGCSNGALGANLKKRYPHVHVTGIEYNPMTANEAGQHLNQVIVADLDQPAWPFQFPDSHFDAIICADVLEHLREPTRALGHMTQWLAPGGTLLISLPNIRHWSVFYQLLVMADWPERDYGIFDRSHLRFFTRRSAMRMIKHAGLRIHRAIAKYPFYDNTGTFLNRIGFAVSRIPGLLEFVSYQWVFVCTK
jgi:methionine biosynthesis protein MetW